MTNTVTWHHLGAVSEGAYRNPGTLPCFLARSPGLHTVRILLGGLKGEA